MNLGALDRERLLLLRCYVPPTMVVAATGSRHSVSLISQRLMLWVLWCCADKRPSQKDLADISGMTQCTVSRAIAALCRNKLVIATEASKAPRRTVYALDWNEIERTAGERA